jgi:hypothetical protein
MGKGKKSHAQRAGGPKSAESRKESPKKESNMSETSATIKDSGKGQEAALTPEASSAAGPDPAPASASGEQGAVAIHAAAGPSAAPAAASDEEEFVLNFEDLPPERLGDLAVRVEDRFGSKIDELLPEQGTVRYKAPKGKALYFVIFLDGKEIRRVNSRDFK